MDTYIIEQHSYMKGNKIIRENKIKKKKMVEKPSFFLSFKRRPENKK